MGGKHLFPGRENEDLRPSSQLPWLKSLLSALKELRYGTVTLVVQDGKVIQIEKNEKVRLC